MSPQPNIQNQTMHREGAHFVGLIRTSVLSKDTKIKQKENHSKKEMKPSN